MRGPEALAGCVSMSAGLGIPVRVAEDQKDPALATRFRDRIPGWRVEVAAESGRDHPPLVRVAEVSYPLGDPHRRAALRSHTSHTETEIARPNRGVDTWLPAGVR